MHKRHDPAVWMPVAGLAIMLAIALNLVLPPIGDIWQGIRHFITEVYLDNILTVMVWNFVAMCALIDFFVMLYLFEIVSDFFRKELSKLRKYRPRIPPPDDNVEWLKRI